MGVDQLAAVNLRIRDGEGVDREFDDQLAVMIAARDDGLIGGIGLSNVTVDHLRHALKSTEIVCVQNPFSLVDRASQPVLDECVTRGIAFVPLFPLGSAFALAWTLNLEPNMLLIPGTSSLAHLEENLAVGAITLGDDVRAQLDAVA